MIRECDVEGDRMINVNLLNCPTCERVGVQLFGHDPRTWLPGTGNPEAEGTHVHSPDVEFTFPAVVVADRAVWTVIDRFDNKDRCHIVHNQLLRVEGDPGSRSLPMALNDHERWGRLNGLGLLVARHMGALVSKRYQHEGKAELARVWAEFTRLLKGE